MKTGNREFEQADRLAEREREAGIEKARATVAGRGEETCIDCGEAISPKRRKAMPSARRCLDCQLIHDRNERNAA